MPIRTSVDTQLSASYSLAASTHEMIDTALFNFINDELNIFCTTNEGFSKVPVSFAVAERAHQIKNDPTLRPNGRTLKYPLIAISKDSMNRNPQNKGKYGVDSFPYFGYYKRGGAIDIARAVNQNKTKNFANANAIRRSGTKQDPNRQTFPEENNNIVYDTLSIPMPRFVEIGYTITAVAEYQQQINEIAQVLQTFTGMPGMFNIHYEGNRYEALMSPDFSIENNSEGLDLNERLFKINMNTTVYGYLIGADKNQETPKVVVRESAAKVTIGRERSVLGDEVPYHQNIKSKYRG